MTKKTSPCSGCSRRALLQGLGVTAIGTLLIGTAAGCQSSAPPTATSTTCSDSGGICVSLSDPANAPLAKAGGAMIVDGANDSILVIRMSDTEVVAVSAVCTHEGCICDFDQAAKVVSCPCHGSQFGQDGHVLRGPARKALRSYTATLANEMITIAA
jgi:cytochrome b6-f complex iron-sulfur subunit